MTDTSNIKYILVDHKPVLCEDLMEWARWMEKPGVRRVRLTRVGPYHVSTVFLGLDHSFDRHRDRDHVPILFETMVWIEGKVEHPAIPEWNVKAWTQTRIWEDTQERCSTWDEAIMQHEGVIKGILADNPGDQVEEINEQEKQKES